MQNKKGTLKLCCQFSPIRQQNITCENNKIEEVRGTGVPIHLSGSFMT